MSLTTRKVKIHLDYRGRGTVEIDGHRIPNVRATAFSSRVSPETELPCLVLELVNVDVEIDADCEVVEANVTTISTPHALGRQFAMLPKPAA